LCNVGNPPFDLLEREVLRFSHRYKPVCDGCSLLQVAQNALSEKWEQMKDMDAKVPIDKNKLDTELRLIILMALV